MQTIVRMLTILLLAGGLALTAQAAGLRTSPLVIESASGVRYAFTVQVAETAAQRRTGLMFRRSLAPDEGMLFDFHAVAPVSMWMKNTFFPLDMLFIDAGGRIVSIAERAVPLSLDSIPSGLPVRAALELNGGSVRRLGIRRGDRVIYPIFHDARRSRRSAQGGEARREALQ